MAFYVILVFSSSPGICRKKCNSIYVDVYQKTRKGIYIVLNEEEEQKEQKIHNYLENIARSQNAAQSTSHRLLRCQVVFTKRLF